MLHRHGAWARAIDERTVEIEDRARTALVEIERDGIAWTSRVPIGELLVVEERGVFARVLRSEVEVGHRAFDARFFLRGAVDVLVPSTRDALLALAAPLEVRVRGGQAVVRFGTSSIVDVVGALFALWDDLDPPSLAAPRASRPAFAPDELLPRPTSEELAAMETTRRRDIAEEADRRRRARGRFAVPPAPKQRPRRAPPASPPPKVARGRAPKRVDAAPATDSVLAASVRAGQRRAQSARAPVVVADEPFEPIFATTPSQEQRDPVLAAVQQGAGPHASAVERVARGVRCGLHLAGSDDGELFIDDADEARFALHASGAADAALALTLTPDSVHLALFAALVRSRARDDTLGIAVLDDVFRVALDAPPLAPPWLADVTAPLLALAAIDTRVSVADERINLDAASFARAGRALAPIVGAAVTVLYVAARARAGLTSQ